MSVAVATIEQIRGETITFGLRGDPAFDGTETVTCDIKLAINGSVVPPRSAAVVVSVTPVFQNGDYLFTVTPAQSGALLGRYITDAKIVMVSGFVDYPAPVVIVVAESVTA